MAPIDSSSAVPGITNATSGSDFRKAKAKPIGANQLAWVLAKSTIESCKAWKVSNSMARHLDDDISQPARPASHQARQVLQRLPQFLAVGNTAQ